MTQSVATRMMLSAASGITSPVYTEFRTCTLGQQRVFGETQGHRGTRQPASCRARILSVMSEGGFSGRLGATEIDFLMPYVFGTSASSTLIPAETINHFYALVDKGAAIYLYNKLRVNQFELSGSEGGYLDWAFQCVGEAEDVYGSSFPASPAFPACDPAFIYPDIVFTYNSTVYSPSSFRLAINNNLNPTIENSLTPSNYEAQEMEVTLDMTFDFRSAHTALYRAAIAGAAASLAMSDGTTTYTFHFGNLKIPGDSPTMGESGRVNMPLRMKAFRAANITTNAGDNAVRFIKS